jgi:hypothetical protein
MVFRLSGIVGQSLQKGTGAVKEPGVPAGEM